jgi:hypothetical protein
VKYFAVTALMLASLLIPRAETFAKGEPSDPACPNADRAIQTYARLAKRETTRVADAIAAADTASAAFDMCGENYRTAGDEERAHYAAVGSAQYRFTEGRLLHLSGDLDRAREMLNAAIAGVADTIAWGTPQEPSRYQAAAIAVRDAAAGELAKLASASPTQSPGDSAMPVASPPQ